MSDSNRQFDMVIRAGRLLPMKPGAAANDPAFELYDQLVGIVGSKITALEPWTTTGWTAKKTINAQHSIVLPGLVNGHCHLPMSLFRGLADDLPFSDWLNKYILPLEAKLVSPELVQIGSELALAEALLSGTTTIYDMYYFEDKIAEVCDQSGIRAVVGETVFDYVAPDNLAQDGGEYRILDRLVERYRGHERIHASIAPHAPYSCSDATLKKVRDYALKHDIAIGIHVSETRGEVDDSLAKFKKTPLKRIYDLGLLEAKTIMAHCVHLTDEEIELAAQTRAAAIYNPESNMKLGTGSAPVRKMLDRGMIVGLGTDGPASNNDLNMFKEMDFAAKLQKLASGDNTAMTAKTALTLATSMGAEAMGLAAECGTLAIGMNADLLVVNARLPHMQPLHDSAAQLVYATTGSSEIDHVICHGKSLVENRKCLTIDVEGLYDRIDAYRKRNSF